MPSLVVQVPRQATASYMPAPGGGTCSWPSGQPLGDAHELANWLTCSVHPCHVACTDADVHRPDLCEVDCTNSNELKELMRPSESLCSYRGCQVETPCFKVLLTADACHLQVKETATPIMCRCTRETPVLTSSSRV
jgi:hypothetical protein